MELTNACLLLAANFLYFFSSGLVAPVLTPHITANGGSHVVLGALVTSLFVCSKISESFFRGSTRSAKFLVNLSLYVAFLAYVGLVVFCSWALIFTARCLHGLTEQVGASSKKYLCKVEPPDQHVRLLNLMDAARVAGIVLGAITGGYIFEYSENFSVVAMVSSICVFVGIVLLQYVEDDGEDPHRSARSYQKTKFTNWDTPLLVFVYTSFIAIFSSRFAFLLSSKHQTGIIVIGYTVAYQTMITFACNSFSSVVTERVPKKLVFEYALVLCGLTLNFLCFAPTYESYLIVFVPMVVSSTLVNTLLEDLDESIDDIQSLAQVVAPLTFGFLCEVVGAKAFKIFVVLPVAISLYLLKRKLAKGEDKVKEE